MQPCNCNFWMAALIFIVLTRFGNSDARSGNTAASRTRWQWRDGKPPKSQTSADFPRDAELDPLFPTVRSQRRHFSNDALKSRPFKFFGDMGLDTVEVSGHFEGNLEFDSMETDEMLTNEIQQLNDSMSILMNQQRRPSYGPDGSINLLPTPNFSFIPDIGPLRQLFQVGSKSIGSFAVCHACRIGLGYLLLQARTKATLEDLTPKAIFICKFFNVANEEVCTGLVQRFGPTMYFILTTRVGISANMFCGMVLQPFGCAAASYLNDWTVDLSVVTPDISQQKQAQAKLPRITNSVVFNDEAIVPNVPKNRLKILQLTDIHLDLSYRPGANAKCDTELCCRADDGEGKGQDAAGYFGDYRKCDLPLHSLENALQHISTQHPDIEIIYMTGDLVAHNVWSTGAKENADVIHVASELIRKYFPTTRIIPVLGNHDVHPLNLFSPPGIPEEVSTDYIYSVALREWGDWIPREAYHTFLHGGFYAVQVNPTFKVIVLNTNVCYTLNFWQVYEHRDPGGQLRWLVKELYEAEIQDVKVHILGHLPPSLDECWSSWSRNFYQIINRFSSTVTSQFYAHTHYDEFQLHYHTEEKGRAINPIWIGASLTPFVNLNPGYKIFSVDLPSSRVIDHETWIYNLTEANLNYDRAVIPPRWYRLYRATEAYNIPDVLPDSLNAFVHRMSSDVEAFDTYYRNYHKASEISIKGECDKTCRKRILCRIVTPYYLEQKECIQIQSEVDGIILPRQIFQNKTVTPSTLKSFRSFAAKRF